MRCGIALGSNLGDRLAHLWQARAEVQKLNVGSQPVLISSAYETDPVDCEPDSSPYLNAVMEIEYDGQPMVLLDALQQIESAHGRPSKRPRNAPRTIDLDVLYAGNLVLSNDEIIIPHPRLHLRRFVLQPLSDIRPDLILPGYHESIRQLLDKLPSEPRVTKFSETWQ
jgi:2-amino-4-hydroxy-6-hydroxymethyldihydropteridine diphosphokinase